MLDTSDPDSLWTVSLNGFDADREQVRERLLVIGDGLLASTWMPFDAPDAASAWVAHSGAYVGEGTAETLVVGPVWNAVGHAISSESVTALSRTLDMRTGILHAIVASPEGEIEVEMVSSLARPGTVALRARGPAALFEPDADSLVAPPDTEVESDELTADDILVEFSSSRWMRMPVNEAALTAAAIDVRKVSNGEQILERFGAYALTPPEENAIAGLSARIGDACKGGFDRFVDEHRDAWALRWEHADIRIDGDPYLQRAVRFNLFHLIGSVTDRGEAGVGARGLSGPGYAGHVFWDTDVFVLPFLAATHAPAARAIVEYRLRRLPQARAHAARHGYAGACFPWESGRSGEDVTPVAIVDSHGVEIPVVTGRFEQHITADVVWSAQCYADWSGDVAFGSGPFRELLADTARFWASRVERDPTTDAYHIRGVIGPDEYHEDVDDSAYTNVMAAWNLRRAAEVCVDVATGERALWQDIAEGLVDGYRDDSRLFEEFAGFFGLEPLIVADVLERPAAADAQLGSKVVKESQVVKQADIVMLLHLLPDLADPATLEVNVDYYDPRTAHGSSLSPAIHAALLARLGRFDESLRWLRTSALLDLEDVTGSAAGGLHTATMGGVWQALVFGFAGVRPVDDSLLIDPSLPPAWRELEVRIVYRGTPIRLRFTSGAVEVDADEPIAVRIGRDAEPVMVTQHRWELTS